MAAVEVHEIPPGSLVALRGVELTEASADRLVQALTDRIGHDQFVLLTVADDADVEVWGPDTDVRARLEQLLKEAAMAQPNALTGVPSGAAQVEGERRIPQPDDGPRKGRIAVSGSEDEKEPVE